MEQNKAERLNENVTEKMCSSDGNVVGEMCSPADADTWGDMCFIVQTRIKAGRLVNSIRNIVEEIVLKELVYI